MKAKYIGESSPLYCIKGKTYKVEKGREYEENGMLKVWDEDGEDYLYPKEMFEIIDEKEE